MSKFYSKEKIIGTGSFGSVWLVKSKISHNKYVLKEVKLTSLNSSEKQQALREVTILSGCRHRNIIRYKDAVIDHSKGVLSIFMEYADGGDLFTAIVNQRGELFPEHTVLTWFVQISLALQYIHHKNILHRDLKTRNIFLTRDKQVKIGDFGIARCLMETNDLATTAIGTPYYLSPEICQRKPYNYKSDIWALGCILFEMAALSHPFQATSFSHLVSLILTGQRKELPRECSSIIQDLVQLILDDNPDTRPSVDEILALPYLQPYLSELWISQGSKSIASKIWSQQISLRRYSLRNSTRCIESPFVRRASVATVDSQATDGKTSACNGDVTQNLRRSSRTYSLQHSSCKYSAVLGSNEKSRSSSKRRPTKSSDLPVNQINKKCKIVSLSSQFKSRSSSQRCNESDCGYQSEEIFQNNSKIKSLTLDKYKIKTSTKKQVDIPSLVLEHSSVKDDVFDSSSSSTSITKMNKDHTHCCHSQCQHCMLDIMWKNRLRGTIGTSEKSDERSEFIQKLRNVFRGNLFDTVYQALISHWEDNESTKFPQALQNITNDLTYSQLTHLPLMMQLIQLDLVKN